MLDEIFVVSVKTPTGFLPPSWYRNRHESVAAWNAAMTLVNRKNAERKNSVLALNSCDAPSGALPDEDFWSGELFETMWYNLLIEGTDQEINQSVLKTQAEFSDTAFFRWPEI